VYLQGGIIESIGCFGAYIISFVMLKVPLSSLWRSTGIYFYEPTKNLTLTDGTIATFSMQEDILMEVQGSYYLAIIIGQLFNLFVTKSRYKNLFRKSAFTNKATYYGAAAAVIIGCIVVFIPGLQAVFETNFVVALALAAPVVTGIFLVCWEMVRHRLHRSGYLK
jgi:magnesium-transporting ATPase (P-type)